MSSAPNRNSVFTPSQATNKPLTAAIQKPSEEELSRTATALSNRFTILKPISASEEVSSYLAQDRNCESPVILKILSGSAASDDGRLKLFYLESRAAARLSHENIVKTSEASQLGNSHFSVVEHKAEARTLRYMLDQTGWLAVDQAVDIARKIVFAIEHAHSKGVWHLGIRPEEVLIEPCGAVYLTGFGIESGNELIWAHKERSRFCPARYISPEQAKESNVDHRADLYAFGIVLFEMLTDRVPFDSHDPDRIRQKHLSRAPEPPGVYREGIPESLSDLVMDLLEKDPDRRIKKVPSHSSLLNRLGDAKLSANSIMQASAEESRLNLMTADFLPFGLQSNDQNVIDAEVVTESDEHEYLARDVESGETAIPIYESTVADTNYIVSELALNSIRDREPFEPPTISTMDLPSDQNYDCTPQIETSDRKPATIKLLPQITPQENFGETSLAMSVSRLIPASVERISKEVIVRRALIIIAVIALIAAAFALMQRSRSSSVQNAVPSPASDGSNGQATSPLPNPQSDLPITQGASTGQEAKAASPPSRAARVRATSPVRKVRKSQNRSKRYQARRVRRSRR